MATKSHIQFGEISSSVKAFLAVQKQPERKSALGLATVAVSASALVTLACLFFWTASSGVFATAKNDDGWEERAVLKLALSTLVLAVTCGSLIVPIIKVWHGEKGSYDRFNLGALAASAFVVGNMLFVSFWYSMNPPQDGNNKKDGGRFLKSDKKHWRHGWHAHTKDFAMGEGKLLAYHERVVSISSLVLGLAFLALSAVVYREGRRLRETTGRRQRGGGTTAAVASGSGSDEKEDSLSASSSSAASAPVVEKLSNSWTLLSSCSALLLLAYVVAIVEGYSSDNLIAVLTWTIAVLSVVHASGHAVLGGTDDQRGWFRGSLGAGMLSAGSAYLAPLLFLVSILYAHLTYDRGDKEGESSWFGAATIAAFLCFGLSVGHVAFALKTGKHMDGWLSAIAMMEDDDDDCEDVRGDLEVARRTTTPDDAREAKMSATGDFVRMEDVVEEKKGPTTAQAAAAATGDFVRMEDNEGVVEGEKTPAAPAEPGATAGEFARMEDDDDDANKKAGEPSVAPTVEEPKGELA